MDGFRFVKWFFLFFRKHSAIVIAAAKGLAALRKMIAAARGLAALRKMIAAARGLAALRKMIALPDA